ncbi:glycosyltransferase [bacterium]|nr:glycosyltransferase [bacterium]
MKISIITVVYNNITSIEKCLMSVANQSYDHIEHIVIDGGSFDGTIDIIKKYSDNIDIFISESDRGIYDALNKGISIASGDVIGFLHSDDEFFDKNVLMNVANNFLESDIDAMYANLQYVNGSQIVRSWYSSAYSKSSIFFGWMPPHPTLYLKSSIYKDIGNFSLHYNISADYEFICRLFSIERYNISYFDIFLVKMHVGGASNASLNNIILKMKEDLSIMRKYSKNSLFTLICKNLRKLPQFFIRT